MPRGTMFDRAPGLHALGPRPVRPLWLLISATLTMAGPLAAGAAAQQSPKDKPCVECHTPEKIGLTRRWIHAPLRNGSCAACHDPHGSTAPHLLKAQGAAACLGCHDRSKFERKKIHPVLASKGCGACHDAHASDIKGLLTAPEGKLCTGCHKPDAAFEKAHGAGPLRTCTKCHDPHSSERPKLLRPSLHEPVAQGRCDACHPRQAPDMPAAIPIAGAGRCAGCHDAASLDGGGPVQHAPVRTGACLSCHDAHASDNPKLTTAPGDALCVTCHRAQSRKQL